MAHDLVIRGGLVVDGTGTPARRADVAVDGDRIVDVGVDVGRGRREIDAEGHVVSPGFVDGHTHMDAQMLWDPLGTPPSWHGITTAVMGNCGFTLAPTTDDAHHLVVRNFERAEDIPASAMAAGIEWSWETFPEYFDALDRKPKGINYASYVGHSALRTWAMGERAFEETGTPEDLALMESQLVAALDAGAIGFTTSLTENHETSDDRPVASRLASWDEVLHLAGVLAGRPGRVMEMAIEQDTRSTSAEERAPALGRMRQLAVDVGVTLSWGLTAVHPDGSDWRSQLELLDQIAEQGGRAFGQSASRGMASVLSFETALAFDKLPVWSDFRSLPLEQQRVVLSDPERRPELVQAVYHSTYGRVIGPEPRKPDFDRVLVMDSGLPPYVSLAELGRAQGKDPVEVMIDLALASDFRQKFLHILSIRDDAVVQELMDHPMAVMTFSDAGAHVSQLIDYSIQTHLLSYWVRDRQAYSLEQAVAMITSRPARAWGFADRGAIAEGMAADLNVFDPATVGPAIPDVVHDLPGGAKRLVQKATGFKATVVNGQVSVIDGEHTAALSGRLLRAS